MGLTFYMRWVILPGMTRSTDPVSKMTVKFWGGVPTLKHYYVNWDIGNKRIGFADLANASVNASPTSTSSSSVMSPTAVAVEQSESLIRYVLRILNNI